MRFLLCVLVTVLVICVHTNVAVSDGSHVTSPWEMGLNSLGLSSLYEIYTKCLAKDGSKSVEECLSTQVVILTEQMVGQNRIPLMEGVVLVGNNQSSGRSLAEDRVWTEENLEASLPRNQDARQGVLDRLMLQKLTDFITTHSLQVELHVGRKLKGKRRELLGFWTSSIVLKSVCMRYLYIEVVV
jgi:hypothetical protein